MKSNCRMSIQKRNCYCGGAGEWCMNMLQCGKCRRWFHDGCVQCLETSILYGDRFYVFICCVCNAGSEYLARVELKWMDIAHLVLYNLSVIHKKKYFDIDTCIMPFLCDHWVNMQLVGEVLAYKPEERRELVMAALRSKKKRFICGKEVKKRSSLWALRNESPPMAPNITPYPSQTEQDVIVWHFKVWGRKSKVLCLNKKFSTDEKNRSNLKCPSPEVSVLTPGTSSSERLKYLDGKVLSENNVKKPAVCKIRKDWDISDNEDSTPNGLLDALIPFPPNFKQSNHPFKKLEKPHKKGCTLSSKRKRQPDSQKGQAKEMQATPKRRATEQSALNGTSNGLPSCANRLLSGTFDDDNNNNCKDKVSLLASTKTFLSHYWNDASNEAFCIVGKRITSEGKIQYLFEWNR